MECYLPYLFSVYLDELFSKLQESGIGCKMGNSYAGCLAYADDLSLLSPTKIGWICVRNMLKKIIFTSVFTRKVHGVQNAQVNFQSKMECYLPYLFSVYLDELFSKLQESGIGCKMGNSYAGCLAYADDLSLLSPTKIGLQKLVDLCEEYAKENYILFNGNKSQLALS